MLFLEHDSTVHITDGSNTNECVGKLWHDVSVVGKSAANCRIVRVSFAADVSTCPLAVPNLIIASLVFSVPCGAVGA